MSSYTETLSLFLNILKTSPSSNKTLFSGILSAGSNSSNYGQNQIAPAGIFNGQSASQLLVVACDGPLSLTFNNGITSFTTTVESLAVIPGTIASYSLTNNGTTAVNINTLTV